MATTLGLCAEDILESMTRVLDPEYGINVVDLGLVYGIEVNHGTVLIRMTMTSPGSRGRDAIVADVHGTLKRRHPEIVEIVVDVVQEPEWRPDYITEAGQLQLRRPIRLDVNGERPALTDEAVLESLKLVMDPRLVSTSSISA